VRRRGSLPDALPARPTPRISNVFFGGEGKGEGHPAAMGIVYRPVPLRAAALAGAMLPLAYPFSLGLPAPAQPSAFTSRMASAPSPVAEAAPAPSILVLAFPASHTDAAAEPSLLFAAPPALCPRDGKRTGLSSVAVENLHDTSASPATATMAIPGYTLTDTLSQDAVVHPAWPSMSSTPMCPLSDMLKDLTIQSGPGATLDEEDSGVDEESDEESAPSSPVVRRPTVPLPDQNAIGAPAPPPQRQMRVPPRARVNRDSPDDRHARRSRRQKTPPRGRKCLSPRSQGRRFEDIGESPNKIVKNAGLHTPSVTPNSSPCGTPRRLLAGAPRFLEGGGGGGTPVHARGPSYVPSAPRKLAIAQNHMEGDGCRALDFSEY